MEHINGFIAAPFTPMDKSGNLNPEIIQAYARFYERNYVDGAFICGTSGEGLLLTINERKLVAEKWKSGTSETFKNIVHIGGLAIEESKQLARHASEIGAWGTAAMAPVFFKPKHIDQLVDYCAALAEETPGLPFYFYHIPAFTGVTLSMVEFLKAAESRIPNLAGIKYTDENLYEFNQCMQVAGGKFDMLHGQDETLICGLALGAKGGVGGTYNHIMGIYLKLKKAFDKGDLSEARKYQNISQEFINILIKYGGNVNAGKRMMKFLGLDCGPNRIPVRNLTRNEELTMKRELQDMGFFDLCNT